MVYYFATATLLIICVSPLPLVGFDLGMACVRPFLGDIVNSRGNRAFRGKIEYNYIIRIVCCHYFRPVIAIQTHALIKTNLSTNTVDA